MRYRPQLGLGLASKDAHSAPIVTELAPGSQASRQPALKRGMVLFAVNGNEVKGLGFDQVLHQIKFTPRPAALTFIVSSRPDVAERRAPDVPPRVPLPSTPGYLSAESEDLGESYLSSSPGRELQLARHDSSPLSRPDFHANSPRLAELRGGTQQGSPGDGRVRVSAESSASAQGDMAIFRQKIEDAAKVVAPLSQRAEEARVAFIAARAALDELQLSKSMLSQQLMYLMTHSEGTSSSGEISALQQRIEEQGRTLTGASRRHEEAEFALREAEDDLEDAIARKRLLHDQLEIIMEGSEGTAGRLAVNCELSIRIAQDGMAAAVRSALDGAAAVLRLGGTTYFIGYAHVEPAELEAGPDATVSVDVPGAGAVGEEGKRLWHFEIDGGEKELRFELHPPAAARAWLAPATSTDTSLSGKGSAGGVPTAGLIQPPTDLPLAVANASVPFVMATPALDLHLPVRVADVSPLMRSPDFAALVRTESQRPGADDSLAGWHTGEVHVETLFVPVSEADEFIGVHSAAHWFEKKGPVDVRDSYGFAVGTDSIRAWRRGESHAQCMESLQRDCWEAFAESTVGSGGSGMGMYSLGHFGTGGSAPRQESLTAWWQQTAAVRALVRGGIPSEDRGRLWFELSGAAAKKAAHEESYFCQLAESAAPPVEGSGKQLEGAALKRQKQIMKDIARTFAGEKTCVNTDEGRASLCRVLFAYAAHNPTVGYCQSMNLLLAHILIQRGVDDEAAFWMLATLTEDIVPGYHTPSMEGLATDLQVLNELLQEEMPRVKTALNVLSVPLDLIVMELFVGVFCTTLPRHTLYRLWDLMFYEGGSVLMAAVMELFQQCQRTIEGAQSMDEVLSVFSRAGRSYHDSVHFIAAVSQRLDQWPCGRLVEKRQRYTLIAPQPEPL